jgi:hypothetical protein
MGQGHLHGEENTLKNRRLGRIVAKRELPQNLRDMSIFRKMRPVLYEISYIPITDPAIDECVSHLFSAKKRPV